MKRYLLSLVFLPALLLAKESELQRIDRLRVKAEQGDAIAQLRLGVVYLSGRDVPKDTALGLKLIRSAAEKGNAIAQLNLGGMYARGGIFGQDYSEAAKWYRKAAEQGYNHGQMALAELYAAGNGLPKDEIEALAWINLAARYGTEGARGKRKEMERLVGPVGTAAAKERSKQLSAAIEAKRAAGEIKPWR